MRYWLTLCYLLLYLTVDNLSDGKVVMHIINAILILTIGLIHGSNDLKLYEAVHSRAGLWKLVSVKYCIVLIVVAITYVLSPMALLIGYVILSGYHFGEELNEGSDKNKFIPRVNYALLGLLIFLSMFYFNLNEFQTAYDLLTGDVLSTKFLISTLMVVIAAYLITAVILVLKKQRSFNATLGMMALFAIFIPLFYYLDLFSSFTVFFVIWHSLPSLDTQRKLLYAPTKKGFMTYFNDAWPIYVLSLVGTLILYLAFYKSDSLPTILFLALIAITTPHIFIISQFYGSKTDR